MRILIVEDHEPLAAAVATGLREERYDVDIADNGNDALSQAAKTEYAVILLDIMLPGISGIDVLTRLRQSGDQTPVLLLTARSTTDDKIRGLDAGADDYLPKPFEFDELLARIRALSRRAPLSADSRLRLADLEVDPVSRNAFRGGDKIVLTVREYGLLEYLMRNQGRVLTRNQIMEHVWDLHTARDTNVVDVYIRYLRQKVDEGHEQPLIHTVRGVGYVLREDP
jgi:DNA-binding response OmpR family regulator